MELTVAIAIIGVGLMVCFHLIKVEHAVRHISRQLHSLAQREG